MGLIYCDFCFIMFLVVEFYIRRDRQEKFKGEVSGGFWPFIVKMVRQHLHFNSLKIILEHQEKEINRIPERKNS